MATQHGYATLNSLSLATLIGSYRERMSMKRRWLVPSESHQRPEMGVPGAQHQVRGTANNQRPQQANVSSGVPGDTTSSTREASAKRRRSPSL